MKLRVLDLLFLIVKHKDRGNCLTELPLWCQFDIISKSCYALLTSTAKRRMLIQNYGLSLLRKSIF
jgi:hypothetical protein